METNVEEIKESEEVTNINNYFKNTVTSSSFGSIAGNFYCNIPEFLLESQKELIDMLKKENQQRDVEIATLKKRIEDLEK